VTLHPEFKTPVLSFGLHPADSLIMESKEGGPAPKRIRLRYAGNCSCGTALPAGTLAGYDRLSKLVVCLSCLEVEDVSVAVVESIPAAVVPGTAGGSAQAEFDRRSGRREARIRAAHPKLGGLILALSEDPQSTRAWASGAKGEVTVGARLEGLAGDGVLVLHDRRIPGSRANIDHLAVGPSGVFVIDAKRYVDAKVEIRRTGGWRSEAVEQLWVGGRDRTKLVTGLGQQVAAVYEALEPLPEFAHVSVQPALAFVEAIFPMFGSLEIAGVPVTGLRGMAKLVRRPGPLAEAQREQLHRQLADKLPAYQQ
jgi:hypothetical protein